MNKMIELINKKRISQIWSTKKRINNDSAYCTVIVNSCLLNTVLLFLEEVYSQFNLINLYININYDNQ